MRVIPERRGRGKSLLRSRIRYEAPNASSAMVEKESGLSPQALLRRMITSNNFAYGDGVSLVGGVFEDMTLVVEVVVVMMSMTDGEENAKVKLIGKFDPIEMRGDADFRGYERDSSNCIKMRYTMINIFMFDAMSIKISAMIMTME
jgi:hypothetical protein